MFLFTEIIDMAVQIEKNGEKTYLAAIDEIDNTELTQLLEWMAKEEQHHAKWLEDLKKKTVISDHHAALQALNDTLVRDYLGGQTFSLQDVDFSRIRNLNELIRIFIEFENDTILFYDILIAFVPDESMKKNIRLIIEEEKEHIEKLKAFLS